MKDSPEIMELGEDNADEFESLLRRPQQKPMGNVSESVLDTLRYIQQGNPQVETIFVDSDEDEPEEVKKPVIHIHKIQTIKPPRSPPQKETQPFLEEEAEPPYPKEAQPPYPKETQPPYLKEAQPPYQKEALPPYQKEAQLPYQREAQPPYEKDAKPPYHKEVQSQPVPFTVKQVSASNLTSNFMEHGNTIVLQDQSNRSSAMRYLFIPNEVLPIIATAKGPISLNVPGIGPLLIPKPSEMLSYSSSPRHAFIENKKPITVPPVKTPKPVVYDPLSDPKFPCWRHRKGVKRDLEGFSVYERLGFYRTEQVRARACVGKFEGLVKKSQLALDQAKSKLASVKNSKFNMKNIKLVEIDKIKKGKTHGKTKQISEIKNKKLRSDALSPLQKKNLKTLLSWKKRFKPDTDPINDLLLTKKVVILNRGRTEPRTERRRRKKSIPVKRNVVYDEETDSADEPIFSDDDTFQHTSDEDVKPQFDESVNTEKKKRGRPKKLLSEFVYLKQKKQIREVVDFDKKVKRGRPRKIETTKPKVTIKRKPGRPRKVKRKVGRGRFPSNKKLYVDVTPVEVSEEAVKKYNSYYKDSLRKPKSKELSEITIIGNLKQFRNKIVPTKPILVVNKENCAKMNLVELSETNNIVFPTSSSSEFSKSFVKSINKLNIKFVKPDILCQYFSGLGKAN